MAGCLERTDTKQIGREEIFSMHNKSSSLDNNSPICISSLVNAKISSADDDTSTKCSNFKLSSDLILLEKDESLDSNVSVQERLNGDEVSNEEVVIEEEISLAESGDSHIYDFSNKVTNENSKDDHFPLSNESSSEDITSNIETKENKSDKYLDNGQNDYCEEICIEVSCSSMISEQEQNVKNDEIILSETNSINTELDSNNENTMMSVTNLESDLSINEIVLPVYTEDDENINEDSESHIEETCIIPDVQPIVNSKEQSDSEDVLTNNVLDCKSNNDIEKVKSQNDKVENLSDGSSDNCAIQHFIQENKKTKRDELEELISKSKCTIQLVPKVDDENRSRRIKLFTKDKSFKVKNQEENSSDSDKIASLSITPVNPHKEDTMSHQPSKILELMKKPSLFVKTSDQLVKSKGQIPPKQDFIHDSAVDTLQIKIPQLIESYTSKVGISDSNKSEIKSILMKKSHHRNKLHPDEYLTEKNNRNEVKENDVNKYESKRKEICENEKELEALAEKFLCNSYINQKKVSKDYPNQYNSWPPFKPDQSQVIGQTYEGYEPETYLSQNENYQYHSRRSRNDLREDYYQTPPSEIYEQYLSECDKYNPNTFKSSDFSLFIDEYTAEKYNNFIHFMVPDSEKRMFDFLIESGKKSLDCETYDTQYLPSCNVQGCDQNCSQMMQPPVYPSGPYLVPPPVSSCTPIIPWLQINPAMGHPLPKDSTKDSCGQLTITPLDDYGKPCGTIMPPQQSTIPCTDPYCNYPYCSSQQYTSNLLSPIPPLLPTDSFSHQLTITPLEHSSSLPYLHRSAINALTRKRGRPPLDPEYAAAGFRRDAYANVRFSRGDFYNRVQNNLDPSYVDPRLKSWVMLEWAYSGVNITVPRNGGPECAEYLTMKTRIVETVIVLACLVPVLSWGLKNLTPLVVDLKERREPTGKRVLLVMTCLIWGIEIGFKFSSRTVIFLLNPCHVTTALQIYLLAARPSKLVAVIFRFHLNCMNGAILALAFPELDALNLPFETWLYWIQHIMMMVIPLYLLQLEGVYETEKLNDFTWSTVSYCVMLLYHFIILQGIGVPAEVNLNHMLCPAIRDPFGGPWYRPLAVIHQAILCPALNKAFCYIGPRLALLQKQHSQ